MLVEKLLDLNVFELRYFALTSKEKIQKTSGINPMKLNLDWPSVKQDCNYILKLNQLFSLGNLAPSQPKLVQVAGDDGQVRTLHGDDGRWWSRWYGWCTRCLSSWVAQLGSCCSSQGRGKEREISLRY